MDLPKTLNQTTQNGFLSKPPTPPRWKVFPAENEFSYHQGKGLCFSAGTGRSHWDVSHGRWCLSGNVLGWGGLCQHKLSKRFSLQKIPMFSVRFFLEVKSLSQSRTTMASEFRFFPCLLLTVKRLE